MGRQLDHLRALQTQRMDATDRLVEERFASLKLALDLQAAEVARRLEVLNGEAGRLDKMQQSYVPREVYDAKVGEIGKELQELRTYKAETQGKGFAYAPLISLGIAVIAVLIGFYLSQR